MHACLYKDLVICHLINKKVGITGASMEYIQPTHKKDGKHTQWTMQQQQQQTCRLVSHAFVESLLRQALHAVVQRSSTTLFIRNPKAPSPIDLEEVKEIDVAVNSSATDDRMDPIEHRFNSWSLANDSINQKEWLHQQHEDHNQGAEKDVDLYYENKDWNIHSLPLTSPTPQEYQQEYQQEEYQQQEYQQEEYQQQEQDEYKHGSYTTYENDMTYYEDVPPYPWEKKVNVHGYAYYYNFESGCMQWHHPSEDRTFATSNSSNANVKSNVNANAFVEDYPAEAARETSFSQEWIQLYDEGYQSYYYYNKETRESSWELPGVLPAASGHEQNVPTSDYQEETNRRKDTQHDVESDGSSSSSSSSDSSGKSQRSPSSRSFAIKQKVKKRKEKLKQSEREGTEVVCITNDAWPDSILDLFKWTLKEGYKSNVELFSYLSKVVSQSTDYVIDRLFPPTDDEKQALERSQENDRNLIASRGKEKNTFKAKKDRNKDNADDYDDQEEDGMEDVSLSFSPSTMEHSSVMDFNLSSPPITPVNHQNRNHAFTNVHFDFNFDFDDAMRSNKANAMQLPEPV